MVLLLPIFKGNIMESQFRNFFKFKVKLFKHKIIMDFSDIETKHWKKTQKRSITHYFKLHGLLDKNLN